MFDLPPFFPPDDALIALGMSMHTTKDQERSKLPAGYVFLGQFIDHDLSRDAQGHIFPCGIMDPKSLVNMRSSFFNLDVLYGQGPGVDTCLYQSADSIRLKLSETTPGVFVTKKFPNDLPRKQQFSETEVPPNDIQTPLTIDPRQDENLAISQMHVAFVKFHNAVIDSEFGGDDSPANFEKVKEIVTRHYQWVVLHDFLPRLVQPDILAEVISAVQNGEERYYYPESYGPFMPVEFSVAAFRMGHSIVSQAFNWNSHFTSASVKDLSDFTARGRMGGAQSWSAAKRTWLPIESLPSRWIIDWTRFFDFTGIDGSFNLLNFSAKIDTSIIDRFRVLIPDVGGAFTYRSSLAVRNLFRGRALQLPTGQAVARLLGEEPISAERMTENMDESIKAEFGENTPLWYYILKEAELLTNDESGTERLGRVGSRIMAETMVGLIKVSPISILDGAGWKPTLCPEERKDKFGIADLLHFVGDLNPVG